MKTKFKKGAASFYVVVFSTLILLIIAASFTALVVAQITRTSNADLAQSAYDSAMAGVEDAKLAFYSYKNCLEQGAEAKPLVEGGDLGCSQIVYLMETPDENDCGVVAKILARNDGSEQVMIEESAGNNNMSQAYTCVKIQTKLHDYRASLSSDQQMKVIRPRFDGVAARDIKQIRISWGTVDTSRMTSRFLDSKTVFPSAANLTDILNPPVISLALLQAGDSFKLSDFDRVAEGRTNRGMVFLVPKNQNESLSNENVSGYVYPADRKILARDFVKSNDKLSKNMPFVIDCDQDADTFLCSALIELPEPIEGTRSDENFVVAVSLPYGKPATDFSLQFCTGSGACDSSIVETAETGSGGPVVLKGMQLGVDSTGRANDLFRRVETRLEEKDDSVLSIMGPLELFGGGAGNGNGGGNGSDVLNKSFPVKCEYPPFVAEPTCK